MTLTTLGLTLILAGFVVTILAILLLFIRMAMEGLPFRGKTRGGGLIMIGPVPIIFGKDKESVKILLILSVALMIIALVIMLLPHAFF